jgi:hypothetical protein
MGRQKRQRMRAYLAHDRRSALQDELEKHGVRDIWDLPVHVHWYHRAVRLQQAGKV